MVDVRLPSGIYMSVPVAWSGIEGGSAHASVIKDAGDDPDITNGAEIRAKAGILRRQNGRPEILLTAGRGVGLVTKPGLAAAPGEPAINPVPRQMIADNIGLELTALNDHDFEPLFINLPAQNLPAQNLPAGKPALHLPLHCDGVDGTSPGSAGFSIMVEIEVPEGEELARHTLNPRLGILGGISILGTTGIVKPFSHEAYEQTIQAALSVAASNGCGPVVLSTGGKASGSPRTCSTNCRPRHLSRSPISFPLASGRHAGSDFPASFTASFSAKP